ncbi:MAG: hypothetical protein CMK09_16170 [Ponticaulis sp.]|nr:hypothetical protein [Ponticaulis sp.]
MLDHPEKPRYTQRETKTKEAGSMKSKALALGSVAMATLTVTGCGSLGSAAGFGKRAPDEFNVVTKAPLVVPPEYALRPPNVGAELPQELDAGTRGRTILFGQELGQDASAGERALIASAGATASDVGVRTRVDYENGQIIRKSSSFVGQVLNFVPLSNSSTDAEGNPLDAEAETQRLRDIDAANNATGGESVVIQRDAGGFKLPGT